MDEYQEKKVCSDRNVENVNQSKNTTICGKNVYIGWWEAVGTYVADAFTYMHDGYVKQVLKDVYMYLSGIPTIPWSSWTDGIWLIGSW